MEKIILKNVNKIYKKDGKEIKALNNINYKFEEGKFYGIIGHSGSGKTSLLQIIGCLDNEFSGEVFINDIGIGKLSEGEKTKIRINELGFIFQNFYLNKSLKVIDNVMLPMYVNKKIKTKERRKKAEELLSNVQMLNRQKHYPNELSGGESQRVAISRALANNPNIILADEPTGNLDKENEQIVFNLLKKLAQQGKCVIVVSHSNQVNEYADEIIHIENGEIINED